MANKFDYSPLVSIIIPAYNAANYLSEAIDSALAQTYSNIEVIVINDGSKDNGETEKIALSYGNRIKYYAKENGGSSSALNFGISKMQGEWFSWLSHDDLYYPEKIERQIEFLNELPNNIRSQHVLFSASELINATGKIIRKPSTKCIAQTAGRINSISGNEFLIAEPTKNNFHGCSCLVNIKVFNEIGCFDENLRLLNDVDMWYRIYSHGYIIRYVPEILVKGRVHAKQLSTLIGYSYHNSEQDMFWSRSLHWLKDNHPQNFDLFFSYGKNAYKKTRYSDGDVAFRYAKEICSNKSIYLKFCKTTLIVLAKVLGAWKKLYIKQLIK